jgi:hypothetical protein
MPNNNKSKKPRKLCDLTEGQTVYLKATVTGLRDNCVVAVSLDAFDFPDVQVRVHRNYVIAEPPPIKVQIEDKARGKMPQSLPLDDDREAETKPRIDLISGAAEPYLWIGDNHRCFGWLNKAYIDPLMRMLIYLKNHTPV